MTVTTAVDGGDRGGEDRALAILQAVTFAAERIMRLPVDEAIDDLLARLGQATGATRVALIRAHRLGDEAWSRMDIRSQWTATDIEPLQPPVGGYPQPAGGYPAPGMYPQAGGYPPPGQYPPPGSPGAYQPHA